MLEEKLKRLKTFIKCKTQLRSYFISGVNYAEDVTALDRSYLILSFVFLSILLSWFGLGNVPIVVIGFIYPALASMKSLGHDRKDEYSQWIIYWIVLSAFAANELLTGIHACFYIWLKYIFCAWCLMPFDWNGATILLHFVQGKPSLQPSDDINVLLAEIRDKASMTICEDEELYQTKGSIGKEEFCEEKEKCCEEKTEPSEIEEEEEKKEK